MLGGIWKPPTYDEEGELREYGQATAAATTSLSESPSMVYLPVEGPELVRKLFVPAQISVTLGLARSGWALDRLLATLVVQPALLQVAGVSRAVRAGYREETERLAAAAKSARENSDD